MVVGQKLWPIPIHCFGRIKSGFLCQIGLVESKGSYLDLEYTIISKKKFLIWFCEVYTHVWVAVRTMILFLIKNITQLHHLGIRIEQTLWTQGGDSKLQPFVFRKLSNDSD
jgi:hypothetical protein